MRVNQIRERGARKMREVFVMQQRRGIFAPNLIKSITEAEVIRFRTLIEEHWKYMKMLWEPLSKHD